MNAQMILSQLRQQALELQREMRLVPYPDNPWLIVAVVAGKGLRGENIQVEMLHGKWADGADFVVTGSVPDTLQGCTFYTAPEVLEAMQRIQRAGLECDPPMEFIRIETRLRTTELRRRLFATRQAIVELDRSLHATCPSLAHA